MGLYGIAIAVGILSTLGITFGDRRVAPVPIMPGAEMSGLSRKCESAPRAGRLGNTTAATGKGFAIGSATLTDWLLASYMEEIRIGMLRREMTCWSWLTGKR